MSVDVKVTLWPGTQIHHVAAVMAIASGAEWQKSYLGNTGDRWYVSVYGAQLKPSTVTACHLININSAPLSPWHSFEVLYHFEWHVDHPPLGSTGYMMAATPFAIALARRVVDFFGGFVDYCDCDDTRVDYAAVPSILPANDGLPWQMYQEAISQVSPLTEDEIEAMKPFASY